MAKPLCGFASELKLDIKIKDARALLHFLYLSIGAALGANVVGKTAIWLVCETTIFWCVKPLHLVCETVILLRDTNLSTVCETAISFEVMHMT